MPEEQEMKIAQMSKILSFALMVVIFVGLTALPVFKGDDGVQQRLAFSNDGYLTLLDSSGWSREIHYNDLTEVLFFDAADFGQPVTGGTADGIREGLWRSESLGDYIASADESLQSCVFLRTPDAAYAISYESDQATEAMANALAKAAGLERS